MKRASIFPMLSRPSTEVVRRRVPRLVEDDVVRARNLQPDGIPVGLLFDGSRELRTFALKLGHRSCEVVAHQEDLVVPGAVVRLPLIDLMRRVYADLARATLEDEPPLTIGLLDKLPRKDVTKERASGFWIFRIDKKMDGRNHRTSILNCCGPQLKRARRCHP